MAYICNGKANVKGLEEVEKLGRNGCTLRVDQITRDERLQKIIPLSLKLFSR